MEEITRRGLAGRAVLGTAGLAAAPWAQAAPASQALNTLAKAKGFVGFGSCAGAASSSKTARAMKRGMTIIP